MSHYFIVDDVISESGCEGFCLMHGDPHEARGFIQHESRTLRECLARVPAGETVYRVRLARRHGTHTVKLICTGV